MTKWVPSIKLCHHFFLLNKKVSLWLHISKEKVLHLLLLLSVMTLSTYNKLIFGLHFGSFRFLTWVISYFRWNLQFFSLLFFSLLTWLFLYTLVEISFHWVSWRSGTLVDVEIRFVDGNQCIGSRCRKDLGKRELSCCSNTLKKSPRTFPVRISSLSEWRKCRRA